MVSPRMITYARLLVQIILIYGVKGEVTNFGIYLLTQCVCTLCLLHLRACLQVVADVKSLLQQVRSYRTGPKYMVLH